MRLCFKIWFDNEGKAFGEGPYRLLKGIQRAGSLNQAIAETGISYRKAWSVLNATEKRLGFALVERKVGGTSGGGTHLTAAGIAFLKQYEEFREEVAETLDRLYRKHFPEPGTPPALDAARGRKNPSS